MDDSFAEKLEAIAWFASCGQPLSIDLPFSATLVSGWPEAIERCSDPSWEDTTLEARNQLTVFLHKNYPEANRNWNEITSTAKERVVTPLMNRVWRPYSESNALGNVLVDCVSWDVLAAIMEHEYRGCKERPAFFLNLLCVYKAGHFPCGWVGEWPAGELLVW